VESTPKCARRRQDRKKLTGYAYVVGISGKELERGLAAGALSVN
jgi:hypothetical protein